MRRLVLALLAVGVCACGGAATGVATSSGPASRASQCDYLSKADFQMTLGLALAVYRQGQSCSYRDARGDTCNVTIKGDGSQYAVQKTEAARYGTLETLPVGDHGFYSAQLQSPPDVWVFDFGFTKRAAFAGVTCGGHLGAANPKPMAMRLANLLATEL